MGRAFHSSLNREGTCRALAQQRHHETLDINSHGRQQQLSDFQKRRPLAVMGKRQYATNDYDSDDGFEEEGRKSKKPKVGKPLNSAMQTDDEGNEFWEVRAFVERLHFPQTALTIA